ncbi:MAG: hypothetical protein K1X44_08715 [Alphaproteobacteria bacterium]|nr:hypothetical protein [Alphaproteobacteria bacterium]
MKPTTLALLSALTLSILTIQAASAAIVVCQQGFDTDKGVCVEDLNLNIEQNRLSDTFVSTNSKAPSAVDVAAFTETRKSLAGNIVAVSRLYKDGSTIQYTEDTGKKSPGFSNIRGESNINSVSGKSLVANAEAAYSKGNATKTTYTDRKTGEMTDTYEIDLKSGVVVITYNHGTGVVTVSSRDNFNQTDFDKILGAFDGNMTFLTGPITKKFAPSTPADQKAMKGLVRSNQAVNEPAPTVSVQKAMKGLGRGNGAVGEGDVYNANGKDGAGLGSKDRERAKSEPTSDDSDD